LQRGLRGILTRVLNPFVLALLSIPVIAGASLVLTLSARARLVGDASARDGQPSH
jgi:hypothetical protein